MEQSRLFVDEATGELDIDRIKTEAIPIAKLIALFAVIALVPFVIGVFFRLALEFPFPGAVFLAVVAAQFVLAVGTAIVLLYTITRAIQLAGVKSGTPERPVALTDE